MLSVERTEEIKNIINDKRSVLVTELAERFDVSTETIRRDLAKLEREGYVIKTHGGAMLRSRVISSVPRDVLSTLYIKEKKMLAFEASRFINDGDCIYLDSSTTVLELCSFIRDLQLTVVSNSLDVINALSECESINIICPGGKYDRDSHSLQGIETISFIETHHFDKSFMSCRSISFDSGICDSTELTSEIRAKVIENSTSVFMLADHTKIDRASYARTCGLEKIGTLITGGELSDKWRERLKELDIELIECPL